MTTGLQGYTQGGEGYLGIAISWRPDDVTDKFAFVAPDNFLLAESKGLDQAYTHIEHDAFVGSRDTDKGHRHGKASAGGPFTTALYPTNGAEVWEAALGFKSTLSPLAGDTTTAIQNGPIAAATAPTAAIAAGGTLPSGTYKYAVTFTTGYGQTTIGADSAGAISDGATNQTGHLTAIPVGPIGTTGRNIFRKLGAGAYQFVHALADNTTATWDDTGAATPGANPPTYNTSIPSGISILALATGDAGYNAISAGGRFVYIDAGLKQEIRSVVKYEATPKWLHVGLLGERDGVTITHSGSGTTVLAPGQDLERFITATDFSRNQSNLLPLVSVEDNVGGKYSWQYRGGYVGKLDLKAAAAKVAVTADIMFNKPRVLANGEGSNPSPTAFDDSDASLNDLSFEYQDGFLMIESDPDSTQLPMLQRMGDGTEWELNLNNNLKEEAPMDGTAVKRFLPGAKRKLDVKMKMLNSADYPPIYQEFVSRDKDATFQAQFAINEGTDVVPVWKARCFHLPHVRYVKSQEVHGLTDTVGENVEGVARRANGQEKMYVYSIT